MSEDREETEIPYFTDPEKKTKKSLTDEVRPTSLGLNDEVGGDDEETEPEIFVNPPEYDEDETTEDDDQDEETEPDPLVHPDGDDE